MQLSFAYTKLLALALCLVDVPFVASHKSSSSTTLSTTTYTTTSSTSWTTFPTTRYYNTTSSTTSSSTSSSLSTTKSRKHAKTTSYLPTSTLELQTLAPSASIEVVHPSAVRHPWGPGFIPSGHNGLPQSRTNGNSWLGTFHAHRFPPWIGHGNGGQAPWGPRNAGHTNPYHDAPVTGITRYYNFVISRGTIAPDGVERSVILVNGQFPGPTIEANWGDTLSITCTNELADEGTSIHWHGMLQKGTPFMDGVPGIHSCPIAPGQTFTYNFQADLYGTSWYHAHYSAQYAGGLFGAMIVHGPTNANYDIDLGPILITDYYHDDYFSIVEDVMGTDLSKVAPLSVNNLINGKGVYNCSLVADPSICTPDAGLSHFSFQSGKTHRLRLINAGAEGLQKFSIDGHMLTVIAYDFVPIVPYDTSIVTLGIGQRADVIVHANYSSASSFWMRSSITSCSLTTQPNALAMIYYENADTSLARHSQRPGWILPIHAPMTIFLSPLHTTPSRHLLPRQSPKPYRLTSV